MLNHAARFSFRRGMTILSLKGTRYLSTSLLRVSASGRAFKAPRPLALAHSSPTGADCRCPRGHFNAAKPRRCWELGSPSSSAGPEASLDTGRLG